MNITALIQKMAILFFTLGVGYASAKAKILTEQINKSLSVLIVYVTNPLLILSSVMTGEHLLTNRQVLLLIVIASGIYVFTIATSFLLAKVLRVPAQDASLYRFLYIFSNVGFIGYPLVSSLFGPSAMFYVSIFVLVFQLVCWSYGVNLMKGEPFRWNWGVLKSPCIAAAVLALILYCTRIDPPALVGQAFSYVGDLTSPLAMLIIGCSLAQMPLRNVFIHWRMYVLSFIKLIVLPVFAWLVLHLFIRNELILGVTVIIMGMPSATNATLMAYQYGADDKLASSGVFLTTLLSLVTIPAVMAILF